MESDGPFGIDGMVTEFGFSSAFFCAGKLSADVQKIIAEMRIFLQLFKTFFDILQPLLKGFNRLCETVLFFFELGARVVV